MKKYELIRFKSAKTTFECISNGRMYISIRDNNIRTLGYMVYYSQNKKWAEIILEAEQPEQLEQPERKPLLVSEDGFDLFEGNLYYLVYRNNNEWYITLVILKQDTIISDSENNKAFKLQQNAQAFRNENNKVYLEGTDIEIKIIENEVKFYLDNKIQCINFLTKKAIEQINNLINN